MIATASVLFLKENGVNDLQIGAPQSANVSLLCVLYGCGRGGFTDVLASTQGPAPIAGIEEGYFEQLLAVMDDTALASLDQLNNALSSGTNPGATAPACLPGSSGSEY